MLRPYLGTRTLSRPARREFVATLGAVLLTSLDRLGVPRRSRPAAPPGSASTHPFRIRTVTAGVRLDSAADMRTIESAISFLDRTRKAYADAGYEVQTIRIATQPLTSPARGDARDRLTADLQVLDRVATDHKVLVSVGPLVRDHRADPEFPEWVARLIAATGSVSCSVTVASPGHGVHDRAARTAAAAIAAIARATPGGEGNFRFAAAANCPAGIPFFPVAYHEGADAFALGLESAPIVAAAFAEGGGREAAQARLKALLEAQLGPVQAIAMAAARREGRRYLGIDASPAPGKDASIGAAIEALTHTPFGGASTLEACATITDVLKGLALRTCGYSGLMLPVLEDPVLARRAAERRFTVRELLLYSSVCGTGLDVVPLPGDAPLDVLAALVGDVAALAVKLHKPLSARLFPIPGKAAGDAVQFANPFLTDSVVMPAE